MNTHRNSGGFFGLFPQTFFIFLLLIGWGHPKVCAEKEVAQRLEEIASNSFFKLQVFPKEDFGETPKGGAWGVPCPNCGRVHNNSFDQSLKEGKSIDLWGVVIASDGLAFVPDPMIEPRFMDHISAETAPGKILEVSSLGTLSQAQIWVLRTKGGKPEELGFSASGTPFFAIAPEERMGKPSFRSLSISPIEHFSDSGRWLEVPPGSLVFDERGSPLGYTPNGRLGMNGKIYPWRFQDLKSMSPITPGQLQSDPKVSEFARNIPEVQFKYREVAAGSEARGDYPPMGFSFGGDSEEEAEPSSGYFQDPRKFYVDPEKVFFGYPVQPDKLIIPAKLAKKRIARIKSVKVRVRDKEVEGKFLGVFKDFWGILIGIRQPLLQVEPAGEVELLPGAMVRTVFCRQTSGRREAILFYDRTDDFRKGWKNVQRPRFMLESESGRAMVNDSGGLLGLDLVTRVNRLPYPSEYGGPELVEFFPIQELKSMVENAGKFVEREWVPEDEREEKRLVWLGVEFQGMNRKLAKANNLEGPTRDGKVGLLVSHVYPDSPAEKLGIKVGDVLLEISLADVGRPIGLVGVGRDGSQGNFQIPGIERIPEEYRSAMIMKMPPPWPPVKNTLNSLLTSIGSGEKANILFWSGNEYRKREIILEKGPYDFESTEKFHHVETGVHVRDLTYEVRRFYSLPIDYQGVIVSRVESGSKALIANILPYEIIYEINGKAIRNVSDFKRVLEELEGQKVASLLMKIERMGQKKVVKIEL